MDRKLENQSGMDQRLIYASREGDINAVKILIESGADVHADNEAALRWAAHNDHAEIVGLLLKTGADASNLLTNASAFGNIKVIKTHRPLREHQHQQ